MKVQCHGTTQITMILENHLPGCWFDYCSSFNMHPMSPTFKDHFLQFGACCVMVDTYRCGDLIVIVITSGSYYINKENRKQYSMDGQISRRHTVRSSVLPKVRLRKMHKKLNIFCAKCCTTRVSLRILKVRLRKMHKKLKYNCPKC